ncbi:uncharacterized protein LOC131253540 isoform X2 [Magnolia sinica]|uniref:uncharacterized protein LOC131253540 isoform X2 n=1 Tax=Magnolia sinica TaxID=86752 RepID=UPI00265824FC|nr:uncharacterized protein LOC131253540 isoform X2 [Magnolia sinica]
MDLRTKALKRKPLSDLTNTSPLLPISSSIGPKPNPKPKTRSSSGPKSSSRPVGSLSSSDTSIGSSNALEQLQQCPTNPEPDSSRASENVEWEDFEQLKIYNRRSIQGKNKGKAVAAAVPSSCPPARRIRSLGVQVHGYNFRWSCSTFDWNRLKSHDDVDLSKTLSVPRPKSKKKLPKMEKATHNGKWEDLVMIQEYMQSLQKIENVEGVAVILC